MEHVMNVYASKAAKGCIADFMGYCEVEPEEATMRLTSGLWLVREGWWVRGSLPGPRCIHTCGRVEQQECSSGGRLEAAGPQL